MSELQKIIKELKNIARAKDANYDMLILRDFIEWKAAELISELQSKIDELEAENKILSQGVVLRGARMQILLAHMRGIEFESLIENHPEAGNWFDADGVPVPIDYRSDK